VFWIRGQPKVKILLSAKSKSRTESFVWLFAEAKCLAKVRWYFRPKTKPKLKVDHTGTQSSTLWKRNSSVHMPSSEALPEPDSSNSSVQTQLLQPLPRGYSETCASRSSLHDINEPLSLASSFQALWLSFGDNCRYSSHRAETESLPNVGWLLSAKTECLLKVLISPHLVPKPDWNQNSVDLCFECWNL